MIRFPNSDPIRGLLGGNIDFFASLVTGWEAFFPFGTHRNILRLVKCGLWSKISMALSKSDWDKIGIVIWNATHNLSRYIDVICLLLCFCCFLKAVIGCLRSRDMFVIANKFNSEMQAMVCIRILPSLCGFPFTFKFTSLLHNVSIFNKWYLVSFQALQHVI